MSEKSETPHQAGFVNIIGLPNAGKSTLMNALLGEKLSIVTPRAQTTRHRVFGILNGENYQIVYGDTPGVLDPKYKLQEGMMKSVGTALKDADLVLMVIDSADPTPFHPETLNRVRKLKVPLFIVLNKYDLVGNDGVNRLFEFWNAELPQAKIFPVSATEKIHTRELLVHVLKELPVCPPYFPKDEISDRSMRFFVSEIIREKLLLNYDKEIPYACEVVIESYKEEAEIVKIMALIMVERESQKRIVIGHQGNAIKRMGTQARKDMEAFLGKKVFLETLVKVEENWRSDARKLKMFGYLD